MGCIKETIVLLACIGFTFAADPGEVTPPPGIDCYVCDHATCDAVCNENTEWCANQFACTIHVVSDPSYKNDLISKKCNASCTSVGEWDCEDYYCDNRWWCCTGDFCNENTPKRPFPPDPSAPVGPKGYRGPPGNAGVAGNPGAQGVDGGAGPTGDVGNNGPRGMMGDKGDQGDKGPDGPPGDAGDEGPAGPRGFAGLRGPPGHFGHRGFKGNKGPEGDEGPGGVLGFPGATGIQGMRGERGDQGPSGGDDKGDPGDKGWPGPMGMPLNATKGTKGVKGRTGAFGAGGDDGADGPCTCDRDFDIVCFTVFGDFIFNLPPNDPPAAIIVDGAIYYENTFNAFGISFIQPGPFMRFVAPTEGLYIFFVEAIASCNFATSIELYFNNLGPPAESELIGFTGRSVKNDGQDISIGVFTLLLCMREEEELYLSPQSPQAPEFEDPMDPWENNSPTYVQFTGCLKHRGPCNSDPARPPVAVRQW